MTRAVLLSAVRTPIGRYGGALAQRAPRRPRRGRDRGGRRARRRRRRPRSRTSTSAAPTRPARTTATSRAWRRCSPGLPQSVAGVTVNRLCASGLAAVVAACHAVHRRRRRPLRGRRRRVDEPRAARDGASPTRAFPRGDRDAVRHDARLALPQPGDGGDVPARDAWARRARTWPSATSVIARGSGCVRAALAAALGRGAGRRPLRRRARPGRRASSVDEHPRPDTTAEALAKLQPGVPRRTARSPPATRAASTTAPPRS